MTQLKGGGVATVMANRVDIINIYCDIDFYLLCVILYDTDFYLLCDNIDFYLQFCVYIYIVSKF